MNLDSLFDDLEASFERLAITEPQLENCSVAGLDNVQFGKGHLLGFIEGSANLKILVLENARPIDYVPGESSVCKRKLVELIHSLIGSWIRIETIDEHVASRLIGFQQGLLILESGLVPKRIIRSIELHAVDNPQLSSQ